MDLHSTRRIEPCLGLGDATPRPVPVPVPVEPVDPTVEPSVMIVTVS
jgi:hypothetical protein